MEEMKLVLYSLEIPKRVTCIYLVGCNSCGKAEECFWYKDMEWNDVKAYFHDLGWISKEDNDDYIWYCQRCAEKL